VQVGATATARPGAERLRRMVVVAAPLTHGGGAMHSLVCVEHDPLR